MNYYSMSDQAIQAVIGQKIRSLRLNKNITQEYLSVRTHLSLTSIKAIESGKGKIRNLIVILRELEALDQLDILIPKSTISPLQLAKQQGKQRQRASGKRLKSNSESDFEW